MKILNRYITACILTSVLFISGCVKLWHDSLDLKSYMIEAPRGITSVDEPLANKVWIDTVSVLPPYNIRNLILRKSDVEYETTYYSDLLLSPSENFRNTFYIWFSASGIFREVSLTNRKDMSHRLVVSIVQFYGDSLSEEAVLTIRVTLLDELTSGISVLFSKSYEQKVAIGELIPENLIRAYNQALSQILLECEVDVVKVLE